MQKTLSLKIALWMLLGFVLPLHAFETDVLVRDPSTVVKRDGVYWVSGPGPGIQQFSSTDRRHWTPRGPVFPSAPPWVSAAVPDNKDNGVWAPDVHAFNGKYYLYYCYSTFGSRVSGIGVATNTTLDPKTWVDQGAVTRTNDSMDYNALDPCVFEDAGGKPWLSFGSFFSGIKLIPLDPTTGKQMAGSAVTSLATRPGVPGNPIEASYVYYHDGQYYLFVNWDSCCAGSKSTYNIRVGRSRTVTGPYLDKSGKAMTDGGGTLFLGAVFDNGSGRPFDDQTGPGHVGILRDTDGFWVGTHYEWARDKNGATTLNLNKLAWDSDGWPRVVLDPGPYKMVSNLATHALVTVSDNAVQAGYPTGADSQKWTLNYQGDGFYGIVNVGSKRALSVAGVSAQPGAKVQVAPFARRDAQLWYLQQNENGAYTLLTKNSNKTSALDVPGGSLNDGTPLVQWTANGLPPQEWSFRVR